MCIWGHEVTKCFQLCFTYLNPASRDQNGNRSITRTLLLWNLNAYIPFYSREKVIRWRQQRRKSGMWKRRAIHNSKRLVKAIGVLLSATVGLNFLWNLSFPWISDSDLPTPLPLFFTEFQLWIPSVKLLKFLYVCTHPYAH